MSMKILDAHPMLRHRVVESWHIDHLSVAGSPTLTGRTQVVRSPMPLWRAKIRPVVTERTQKSWSAFLSSLAGRGAAIRIPFLTEQAEAVVLARFGQVGGTPFSDETSFSDGSYFSSGGVKAQVAAAGAQGTTSVSILASDLSGDVEDGDKIGIDGHLYIVTSVRRSADLRIITFEPPLRNAVTTASILTLTPTVVMRLIDDLQGRFDRNARDPIVSSTIEFVELPELT
jgi:hypothetical protein